jgi:hypothetical protein
MPLIAGAQCSAEFLASDFFLGNFIPFKVEKVASMQVSIKGFQVSKIEYDARMFGNRSIIEGHGHDEFKELIRAGTRFSQSIRESMQD